MLRAHAHPTAPIAAIASVEAPRGTRSCARAVFVLQTDKASRKWPADDAFEKELRVAFAECTPSDTALTRQRQHAPRAARRAAAPGEKRARENDKAEGKEGKEGSKEGGSEKGGNKKRKERAEAGNGKGEGRG